MTILRRSVRAPRSRAGRDAKIAPVRRSLAGLLFGLAAIVGSLALSAFWLQFTAFSPDHTHSAAAAVLEDNDIKNEVAEVISNATAAQLRPGDPAAAQTINATVLQVANTSQGAKLLADIITEAHSRLIGVRDEPVQITPEELVEITRDQQAIVVPAVTLDVPKVGPLSVMREVLKWLIPIAAGLAIVFMILGFAAHPERFELLQSLGFLLLGMALLLLVIGYVVPAFVIPLLTDNVWIGAVPRLARNSLGLLLGIMLLLVGAGLGCLAAAAASRRRDRWSQPIRRSSYREERRWS
jgi:hypothetical protein